MAGHLNDRVESFFRLELKPEWLPFRARADFNRSKLATPGYLQSGNRIDENISSLAHYLHLCF